MFKFPFKWQRVGFIQPMEPKRRVYGKTRGSDSCVDYDRFGDIAREGGPSVVAARAIDK